MTASSSRSRAALAGLPLAQAPDEARESRRRTIVAPNSRLSAGTRHTLAQSYIHPRICPFKAPDRGCQGDFLKLLVLSKLKKGVPLAVPDCHTDDGADVATYVT